MLQRGAIASISHLDFSRISTSLAPRLLSHLDCSRTSTTLAPWLLASTPQLPSRLPTPRPPCRRWGWGRKLINISLCGGGNHPHYIPSHRAPFLCFVKGIQLNIGLLSQPLIYNSKSLGFAPCTWNDTWYCMTPNRIVSSTSPFPLPPPRRFPMSG